MDDSDRQKGADELPETAFDQSEQDTGPPAPSANFDESLVDELGTLIDDGRNYAQAELAFQKTRAKLAGRSIGIAAGAVALGLILLHIAFLALAVGLVIALAPLVTIWGAIAIVFGGLLLLVGLLGHIALKNGKRLGALFSADEEDGQ